MGEYFGIEKNGIKILGLIQSTEKVILQGIIL